MTQPDFAEKAINAYVQRHETEHPHDDHWHPSSLSGCLRKALYSLRGVPKTDPKTPRQQRILFSGHTYHEIVQTAIKESDPSIVEVYTEVAILVPDLRVRGHADQLLIAVRSDGKAQLIEIKTIAEYGFKLLLKDEEPKPKEDHDDQARQYMLALRLHGGVSDDGRVIPPLGDRLTECRFIYIEKQRFDIKEIVIQWSDEWETEFRKRVANAELYRANPHSLPPRLPINERGKRDYRCDWGWGRCDYFTRCWEHDPDVIPVDFQRTPRDSMFSPQQGDPREP